MHFALWLTKPILVCLIPVMGCATWIFLRNWYKTSANSIELPVMEEDKPQNGVEVEIDEEFKEEVVVVKESLEEIPDESQQVDVVKDEVGVINPISDVVQNIPALISEEILEEEVPLPATNMSSGALFFGNNNNLGNIENGKIGAKCKLSEETDIEQCSFGKINPDSTKGWIDYEGLKKTGFSAHLEPNFFSNSKTLYQVRLTESFINKWINKKEQHLEVYQLFNDAQNNKNNSNSKILNPGDNLLLNIKPSFAYKETKTYYGESRFYVGKLKELLSKDTGDGKEAITTLDVTNRWFNCTLPGDNQEAKKCFIYEFESDSSDKTNLNGTKLKKHPNKPSTVEKDNYYIIKFLEPQTMKGVAYATSDAISVDVYGNQARTIQTDDIHSIKFDNLAHVIMHHEEWDEGVAIVL